MTIKTPNFKAHIYGKDCVGQKEKLEGIQSEYRIVWEDPEEPDSPAKITIPKTGWLVLYKVAYFHL